ncbi:hypothetical protein D9757_004352 [Collybiopsis confluens]|uniref:Conserved oligomeric Golgi complex subunit 5 n=1 Tax=Collybiopsis confluens TaxID=2823264 RepID=A0A8H5MD18_9AGAR|nr:hypothetical protein D9757_004352 [Collybiopsis confluens]
MALAQTGILSDYSLFASPAFDANDYANAVLAGEPYLPASGFAKQLNKFPAPEPSTKDDISLAISKLSLGIDDVSKQIKALVSTHHEELLSQAAHAHQLSGSLTAVKSDLNDLDASVEKLRRKISVPYQSLNASLVRLDKFQQASDVLRRTSRFIVLARRLEMQMTEIAAFPSTELSAQTSGSNASEFPSQYMGDTGDEKERSIAKAALSITELVALTDGRTNLDLNIDSPSTNSMKEKYSLRSIDAVASYIPFIEDARAKVTNEMENMIVTGLTTLNQSLLASSLQTAYNLGVLSHQVQSLMADLVQDVEDRIKRAFDLSRISKDANKDGNASPNPGMSNAHQYRSRVRTEPTNVTAPQWATALWSRLEKMTEEMADCCIKVYTLEKVLKLKRDPISQTLFLDEVMAVLENKPSATFWTALSRTLEKHGRDSARGSSFIQQTLSTGYPRLLRLFHEFFGKIAVQTDTVYGLTQQSPETILVLRSLSYFEVLYLSRSTNKLNEAVAQAFPSSGTRATPSLNDGLNIARIVTNELDSARFDPLFVGAVARNVVSSLDMLISRADSLIVKDRSAILLSGPSATPAQILNASVATCLYHCHSRLKELRNEHRDSLFRVISPSIDKIRLVFERTVDPLLNAIRRELSAIIARLHRVDFGKPFDRSAGMSGSSFYMKDLVDKLAFLKSEVLSSYSAEGESYEWTSSTVKFVLRTFVLHLSIAKPLSEGGKLQLTTDMTELEFALNAFMINGTDSVKRGGTLDSIGEYRLLRAMRPLLFLDNGQLADPTCTASVPPLIVLHHILVRSPLPLPHSLHGWQEAEYVRWVDEHSEEEARTLIEGGLDHWEKTGESEGKDFKDAGDHHFTVSITPPPEMASLVLSRARTAPRVLAVRSLSWSTTLRADKIPQPPKNVDDSTSALDYKRTQRTRPPPLPAMDMPRSRSAEEAVTNILYNTPPPSLQPFKKHVLNCLVQNEPGVLSRVSGILAGRGFNIDSLVVCSTEIRDLSRMCIVLSGQDGVVEQVRRQLEDLVPVWAVLDYTDTRTITRELLLVKISILGPEYLEDQLVGGPTHSPHTQSDKLLSLDEKLEREKVLAHNFELGAHPEAVEAELRQSISTALTPSQVLRLKHQHLHSISTLSSQFGGKIVDVSENSVIVELTAKTNRVEAFLGLVRPFGILEAARTGVMAMPRTPISGANMEDAVTGDGGTVDASLLPPG